jgi:GT2 family glycosyltransferase
MSKPHVSFVIVASSRYKLLEKLLESLRRQSFKDFEVIVVCIRIDKCVKEIAEKHGVLLLEDQGLGKSYARNLGIKKANGEIIAFLDDDIVLENDWLEKVVKDFQSPRIAGVGGLPIPVNRFGSSKKESRSKLLMLDLLSKIQGKYSWTSNLTYKAAIDILSGSNMAFRSKIVSIESFDENLYEPSIAEDYDLCLRVRSRGYTLVFDPFAKAYHHSNYLERTISKDANFFYSRADNETYYEVKNDIYNVVFFSYQVFVAMFWSTMNKNPKVFFACLSGILEGIARGKRWRKLVLSRHCNMLN